MKYFHQSKINFISSLVLSSISAVNAKTELKRSPPIKVIAPPPFGISAMVVGAGRNNGSHRPEEVLIIPVSYH